MARREVFVVRGVPLGVLALLLAWLLRDAPPSAASGAALLAPLAALLVVFLATLRAAGPWALADLLVPGALFGAAGAVLLDSPHRAIAAAYLAPALLGGASLLVGLVVARAHDRGARARAALLEAQREVGRTHRRLWLGTREVEDGEIRAVIEELALRLEGDPAARAAALLGAAAPLCHARPHLTGELLARPLALLGAAGVPAGAPVLHWVEAELAHGGRLDTDERGRRWLRESLPGALESATRPAAPAD